MGMQHAALNIDAFDRLCQQTPQPEEYPLAAVIVKRVVCYDGDDLRDALANGTRLRRYQQELARVLSDGPGVFVIKHFFANTAVIDRHNQVIEQILEQQANQPSADHFAKAGANGRIWNVIQKAALFHAAGSNHTADFHRIANLLQVSSAFGRAMEAVDREAMCLAIYPELLRLKALLTKAELAAVLDNTCEGYSFPTNLDTDPPSAGMAPQTQKALMHASLNDAHDFDTFKAALLVQSCKRRA